MLNSKLILEELTNALNGRIKTYVADLEDMKNSLNSAAKSSAGDKHETARAHLQIEQERISNQLDLLLKQRGMVLSIKPRTESTIGSGSLVKTNKGLFFISISFGKVSINGQDIFCLSPTSPMGAQLLNKAQGDTFKINNNSIEITETF